MAPPTCFSKATMTKPISATAPSLLDMTAAPAQAAPSLLSSLGDTKAIQSGKKRGRPVFWFVAIPLGLIALVVGAAVVIANNVTASFSPANPPALTQPGQRPQIAPAPKAPAQVEAKRPVAPAEVAPAQVATIINDLPPEPQKKVPQAATENSNNPHDRLRAALSNAPAKPGKSAPVAVTAAKTSAQAQLGPKTMPADSKAKIAQADSDDRDVTLLTALVASTKEIPVKDAHSKKPHHAKTNNKIAAESKNSSADDSRNQDVIERKPGDSTASLLKRCKKLGLIEGELCRWRICSERWDSDLACKANAQPKAPVVDTPAQ